MKKLLIATAVAALGATGAHAADMAARVYTKAPPPMPVVNWTGFYLGGGGGYGLWTADNASANLPAFDNIRTGGKGYFGTVSGGYDWQVARWVLGVFGDAQFGDMSGTLFSPQNGSATVKNDVSYAAGVRVGYLIAPNVLTYVNGGYSHANFKGATVFSLVNTFNATIGDQGRDGYFIGGGMENTLDIFGMKAPGWFLRSEYRLAQYGTQNVPQFVGGVPNGVISTFKPMEQTISTQLLYKFNSGTPVGASAQMYTKAAAMPVNWTGFYVGGGGGYGLWNADNNTALATGFSTIRTGGKGYFGTVSGGYDWQFGQNWVAGIFGDAQFGDMNVTLFDPQSGSHANLKNDLNYAAGARLGYLIAPNVLTYVNGGYSHAELKSTPLLTSVGAPTAFSTNKQKRDGYFVGGGSENTLDMFGLNAPGWFVKTEYRLAQYRSDNVTELPSGNVASFKPWSQTISTQLVYKFNWGR